MKKIKDQFNEKKKEESINNLGGGFKDEYDNY